MWRRLEGNLAIREEAAQRISYTQPTIGLTIRSNVPILTTGN